MTDQQRPIDKLKAALPGWSPSGIGYKAKCPVPAHGDKTASLGFGENPDGSAWVKCHKDCATADILTALRMTSAHLRPSRNGAGGEPTYRYVLADGRVFGDKVRHAPWKNGNRFHWRYPPGAVGQGWTEPKPLYRRKELLEALAADPNQIVLICEGERDVETARLYGFVAVCNPDGAGVGKWAKVDASPLDDCHIAIVTDRDTAGVVLADEIGAERFGKAKSIRRVELPYPITADHGRDLTDYLDEHPAADLTALIEAAPIWTPTQAIARIDAALAGLPVTHTLDYLMAKVFPEARPLVTGIIFEGLTLLAGRGKTGKGRMCLSMALAVAAGGKALGHIAVEQAGVLYLSLEDGEKRLKIRVAGMLQGQPIPPDLHYALEWPRLDEGGVEQLDRWLDAYPTIRLVFIDTFKKVRSRHTGKGRLYDADYDSLSDLADLCKRRPGLAVVVLHHANKLKDVQDALDSISGSTGIEAVVDGVVLFKGNRGSPKASLLVVHRDAIDGDQTYDLEADSLTGGWSLIGDARLRLSPQRRAIVDVLFREDRLGPKAVAMRLDADYNAVKKLMWTMASDGELIADDGEYRLGESFTNHGNHGNPGNRGNLGNPSNPATEAGIPLRLLPDRLPEPRAK